MTELIVAFVLGVIAGIAATLWHQRCIARAVQREKAYGKKMYNQVAEENDQLKGQILQLRRSMDSHTNYNLGVHDGEYRQRHKDNVTRLSESLQRGERGTIYVPGEDQQSSGGAK